MRLNFEATPERIVRLDEQSGFRNLATSNKKDEKTRRREIEAGEKRQEEIRLNRKIPGKEDPFVLDFVNKAGDIYRAFKPYYNATSLQE